MFQRRLGLRRPRRPGARARPLRDGRDRRRAACSSSPTTTGSRARSSTAAATAARASSTRPRARVPRLQCPYHAWSYGFDGSLQQRAVHRRARGLRPGCYGLKPVRLAVVEGLVLLDLSGEAPPPPSTSASCADAPRALPARRAAPRRADHLRGRGQLEGDRRELLRVPALPGRAPGAQPALALPVAARAHGRGRVVRRLDDARARTPRRWRATAATAHRPPIDGLTEADRARVHYFLLFPNTLVSLHPDYVMLHTLWPREADRTEVVCEWFFEPRDDASAEGFDPPDAVDVLGPGQPRGLGRLPADAARHALARATTPGRYTTPGGRRARVRRDGRRPLPRGAAARQSRRDERQRHRAASFDAIVVGGGHNGLTAAAYLARAGMRVCVLERRDILGGACVTEELWPGHRVSRASYVVSMLQPKVVATCALQRLRLRPDPARPAVRDVRRRRQPDPVPNDEARLTPSSRACRARTPTRCRASRRCSSAPRTSCAP